jgi:hypothetical protein
MPNPLSASLNRIVLRLLAIFHNIISPKQLTHCLGRGDYSDTRVDGCCDRPEYVSARLRLLFDIEVA